MTRTELINSLIKHNNYKSYLEIGVNTPSQPGYNWDGVNIELKHGVDPNVDTTFKMESDIFFKNHNNRKYDIIFVDGLHIFEQAYRDIINSLNVLEDGGVIVVHDCNPITEITQRVVRASDAWHGDVWKAIVKLRIENNDISIHTIDTDEGCCIIKKGKQECLIVQEGVDIYNYDFLEKNRKIALNLISIEEFKNIYIGL
jgi:predicted O-methyltransferase YrrM